MPELTAEEVRRLCEEFIDEPPPVAHQQRAIPDLNIESLQAVASTLILPDDLLGRVVAALRHDHIRLIGAPGTGKSTLARAILESAVGDDYVFTAATRQWGNEDVIGGPVPDEAKPNTLVFRPGIILEAADAGKWVAIDEVNRADIDSTFGEFFSLLAGFDTQLPYYASSEQAARVSIFSKRPEGDLDPGEYGIPPDWRMIATMNSWDKASLSRVSFAFSRRWCTILLPLPSERDFRSLVDDLLARWPAADVPSVRNALEFLFVRDRADEHATLRELAWGMGPGIARSCIQDIAAMRELGLSASYALGQALEGYVFPQFEGALEAHDSLAESIRFALQLCGADEDERDSTVERLGVFTGRQEESRH